MRKIQLFLKLYRKQKEKSMLLLLIFICVGAVMSGTLLIQMNNEEFYNAQMNAVEAEYAVPTEQLREELVLLENTVEVVLGSFSFGCILIGIWGGTCLFLFHTGMMQKSFAMFRIYGMKSSDFAYKAVLDGFLYGIVSGGVGILAGYGLFQYLTQKLCGAEVVLHLFSKESLQVFLEITIFLFMIAFFGSLIAGVYLYDKPLVNILNDRREKRRRNTHFRIAAIEAVVMFILVKQMLEGSKSYIEIMILVCGMLILLLFVVFYFIFGRITKIRGKLNSVMGLSYRFLCVRNKRDAILASTISVGAVLICFVMNIELNFSELIRDSYRDNMGYSVAVRMDDYTKIEEVAEELERNGYLYTFVYSKLMDYADLEGEMASEGKFWALVIGEQTDENVHFSVRPGTFAAENYFSSYLNVNPGEQYSFFGKEILCERLLTDNQALSLVSYNILVNETDWKLGLDESWSGVFLLDLEMAEEAQLEKLLEGKGCHMETATQITDALRLLMSDYLCIVFIVGAMIVLVTGAFFYSMVLSDLNERKKELYLYRVYGASRKKALMVVFLEYLLIAWIASFSVVFVVLGIGEMYFLYMLHRHYPISGIVVVVTSLIASIFVMGCCVVAEWQNTRKNGMEIIRDE